MFQIFKMFPLKFGSELQNLVKKFHSARYENINKIRTELSPSGKFPRSGMHTGGLFYPPLSLISDEKTAQPE